MGAAAVEVIQLYRELVAEIRHRENVQRSLNHAKHSRDLAEKECEDLKKRLESTKLAWEHNVASLTADLKRQEGLAEAREQLWAEVKDGYEKQIRELEVLHAEYREENADFKDRLTAARERLPKMKEDDRGLPTRCLRCGKGKGKRAYTCTKCFKATHLEDQDLSREEWAKLRDDWLNGLRDFPRP